MRFLSSGAHCQTRLEMRTAITAATAPGTIQTAAAALPGAGGRLAKRSSTIPRLRVAPEEMQMATLVETGQRHTAMNVGGAPGMKTRLNGSRSKKVSGLQPGKGHPHPIGSSTGAQNSVAPSRGAGGSGWARRVDISSPPWDSALSRSASEPAIWGRLATGGQSIRRIAFSVQFWGAFFLPQPLRSYFWEL